MPVHTIPVDELVAELARLETVGETATTITVLDERAVVTTMLVKGPGYETRLAFATHRARLGVNEWTRDPLLHSFIKDDIVRDGDQ